MSKIALLLTLVIGPASHALNITFDKALEAEFIRCESVLPIRDIHHFALQIEFGFFSADDLKTKFGESTFNEFSRLLQVVTPFLNSLDERGEVMDLTGRDELAISCAKYAKGVLITPYQKLIADMVRNAVREQKKSPERGKTPKS